MPASRREGGRHVGDLLGEGGELRGHGRVWPKADKDALARATGPPFAHDELVVRAPAAIPCAVLFGADVGHGCPTRRSPAACYAEGASLRALGGEALAGGGLARSGRRFCWRY
jgi:hypothetical protein